MGVVLDDSPMSDLYCGFDFEDGHACMLPPDHCVPHIGHLASAIIYQIDVWIRRWNSWRYGE